MSDTGKISICHRLDCSFRRMQRSKRLRVSEVNPHLICVLCGGYYIDATTIIECLHTFCKTCIVGYLEASKHCPVCDNLVHKTKPHLRLRPDHTLQDLVYKLVPGLFQDEMKKRREFYKEEIDCGRVGENGINEERERIIYSADEQISLVLELSSDGNAPYSTSGRSSRQPRLEAADRRYLSCPGNFTVGHLKKFIKMKFNLCEKFQVDFYHTDETLYDHYSLVDIAYIYSWRRKGPLRLYYTVYTNPAKRFKADIEEEVPMETDLADITNNSDLKTETSGYITDEDKLVSENEKSLTVETDGGEHNDSLLDEIVKDSDVVKIGDIVIEETTDVRGNKSNDSKSCISESQTKMPDCDEGIVIKETESVQEISPAATKSIHTVTNTTSVKDDARDDKIVQSKNEVNKAMDVCNQTDDSIVNEKNKPVNLKQQEKCEPKEEVKSSDNIDSRMFKRERPEMVEASTATNSVSNGYEKCSVPAPKPKQSKSSITDDDISEPVVSSTQNTQGCQTEPPESNSEPLNKPHSSEVECIASSVSPSNKSTVDVSCETDNFVLSRQMSVDSVSVSVSTETETDERHNKPQKRKLVDCSTDVYDFPKSESSKKLTVDCSTDFDGFPDNSIKRLTVDCSTSVDNYQPSASKRKSMDADTVSDTNKGMKKTDTKAIKRSFSCTGQLTSPKTAYLAQPLSPTKLTLKFTSPKSPAKTPPTTPGQKSPSRAETTGFQSKYQSFVMDEKAYRFEDEEESPKPSKPSPSHKSCGNLVISIPQTLPATQKKAVSSKTGRPRGRPPKNRSLDSNPIPKEKKHKSRSHSPKHRRHSDKDGSVEKLKISKSVSGSSKSPTAYSWINKLEGDAKLSSEKKSQKAKQTSANEKSPSDLRIPKQFLYFSNGQYTIATVSSLNALKQSSPVSPPPKTVFTAEINNKNRPKHFESDVKKQKTTTIVTTATKEREEKTIEKLSDKKIEKSVETTKQNTYENRTQNNSTECKTSPKIDSNQNKIERTQVSKSEAATTNVSESVQSDGPKKVSEPSKEIAKEKPTQSLPEYRHQSPFFASNAKLQVPHRATAHLNVPNITSHFSGTHHLYSQGRYSNDRITPLPSVYRSMSMNDTNPASTLASKFEEARRLEAIASVSHGYLSHFPAPYLGLMHSHLVSSLPPPPPLSKHSHTPETTRSMSFSECSSPNSANSQNGSKQLSKVGSITPKGKEKSIDRIISAITERKTKKETQEQINGIDLSTKSSRQTEKSANSVSASKTDKFEFTDDDDAPILHKKVIGGKVENVFEVRKEKV